MSAPDNPAPLLVSGNAVSEQPADAGAIALKHIEAERKPTNGPGISMNSPPTVNDPSYTAEGPLLDVAPLSASATPYDQPIASTSSLDTKPKIEQIDQLQAELFPESLLPQPMQLDQSEASSRSSSALPDAQIKAEQDDGFTPRRSKRGTAPRTRTGGATSPTVLRKSFKAKKEESDDDSGAGTPRRQERQFIFDLPDAEAQAMSEFEELESSTYQNKSIGAAKAQEDSFQCECTYTHGSDPSHWACGEDSGCINRLTQVECPKDDCRCKKYCQNQRIQKKQYAPLRIVQTEKKGYGVMANDDLPMDALVYEYIGEVIGHKNFVKRMSDYYDEGIRHFYFMALQKDEFIDATKKGGKGRFLNHSCNPNCYVAKWVVGRRLRMGIFTKRKVQYGEELTFNYNVDRYGHEAQECYCGEPNCIGFIGGKTQTDIGFMDDLYLDALGITEEVEALGLKGNRRKKGKKLDDDFNPVLRPILIEEAPKVISAVRQAASIKRILTKLLTRMMITEDPVVQSQLMRLRGFSLMAMLLEEHEDDQIGVVQPVLQIMKLWPLLSRNKLSNTTIEPAIQKLTESSPEEQVRELAKELLASWSELALAYRIPRALRDAAEADSRKHALDDEPSVFAVKRARMDSPEPSTPSFKYEAAAPTRQTNVQVVLYDGWQSATNPNGQKYYYHIGSRTTRWQPPSKEEAQRVHEEYVAKTNKPGLDLNDIIAKAQAQAEAIAAANAPPPAVEEVSTAAPKLKRKREKKPKPELPKEKRVLKLFSPVVVKAMSKYAQGALGKTDFKRRAQELTNLLVEKEAKSSKYADEEYKTLSPDKENKIRHFVKDWVIKLLARKGISGSSKSSSSRSSKDSKHRSKESITSQPSASGSKESTAAPDTPTMDKNELEAKKAQEAEAAAAMLAELEAAEKEDEEQSMDEDDETNDSPDRSKTSEDAAVATQLASALAPPPPPPEDVSKGALSPPAPPSNEPPENGANNGGLPTEAQHDVDVKMQESG